MPDIAKPYYAGRKKLYNDTDVDAFAQNIQDYFDHCDQGETVERLTKRGELVQYHREIPYTIEDMAHWLNMTRETLSQYAKKPAFSDVILRAKEKIHSCWLKRGLYDEYNAKIVALLLAANSKRYNVSRQAEQHTTITIEDRIRQVRRERLTPPVNVTPKQIENNTDG